MLFQSPWARDGFARMEEAKQQPTPGGQNAQMPDTRPGTPRGGVNSVAIGEPMPPRPPKPGGEPVQFRVLARWETAAPVRLAGGPEVPEMTGQFYVIRLRGLPLMATASDSKEAMLQAIQAGTRLERAGKPAVQCEHLFSGSGDAATEVLLFFPRAPDPIRITDKTVILESHFAVFHLSVKFPLKDMVYKGKLAL